MEITYKTKKLERVCTDYSFAKRTYGEDTADLIYQRIYEISSTDTVEQFKSKKCICIQKKEKEPC